MTSILPLLQTTSRLPLCLWLWTIPRLVPLAVGVPWAKHGFSWQHWGLHWEYRLWEGSLQVRIMCFSENFPGFIFHWHCRLSVAPWVDLLPLEGRAPVPGRSVFRNAGWWPRRWWGWQYHHCWRHWWHQESLQKFRSQADYQGGKDAVTWAYNRPFFSSNFVRFTSYTTEIGAEKGIIFSSMSTRLKPITVRAFLGSRSSVSTRLKPSASRDMLKPKDSVPQTLTLFQGTPDPTRIFVTSTPRNSIIGTGIGGSIIAGPATMSAKSRKSPVHPEVYGEYDCVKMRPIPQLHGQKLNFRSTKSLPDTTIDAFCESKITK